LEQKRTKLEAFKSLGYRAIVRVPEPKRKKLGKKRIDCIFIGYALVWLIGLWLLNLMDLSQVTL